MMKIMSNLRLRMIQFSRSQSNLTYLNVEIIYWTSFMQRANKRAWQPQ